LNKSNNILSKIKNRGSALVLTLFILTAIIAVFIDSQSLASATDLNNIYKAPFENSDYLLGTDDLGRSVFYGLINGAKITLFIAVITSVLSLVIGLLFAFIAAHYGNDKLKLNLLSIIGLGIITFVCHFYFIYSSHKLLFFSAWLLSILGTFFINRRSSKIKTGIKIPIDTLILKILEILKTLPGIFIVLLFLSLFDNRSIWNVIFLITFVRTPVIIRLGRSEILKIKSQEYILAAEGMGIGTSRLFLNHIIPNIISPLRTFLVYGIASTVLIESVLSFLGLGLPIETVSWGSMLSSSRQFFSAWWLAILPGLAIFILIYSLRQYFTSRAEDQEYFYI